MRGVEANTFPKFYHSLHLWRKKSTETVKFVAAREVALAGGNSARRHRRAVIIGGSMSGLFSAAYLRQLGWAVDIYERSREPLVSRGAGITTHPEFLESLDSCGAGTRDLGVEVEKRVTINQAGRVIGEKSLRQILTSWDRLQYLLQQNVPAEHYHLGCAFERVEQDGSGVRVHFADG